MANSGEKLGKVAKSSEVTKSWGKGGKRWGKVGEKVGEKVGKSGEKLE